MAKLSTKKAKKTFSEHIIEILVANGIVLEPEQELSITKSMIEFFNTTYKPPKEPPIEYWTKIVDHYFEFYKELNNGIVPAFTGSDPKALKGISSILKERHRIKTNGAEWTEKIALQKHNELYNQVITLPFAKKNFSVSYIYNNFDKIISELINAATPIQPKVVERASEEEVLEWLKRK